jgi:glycerophosphoryl diester phosphodiesterase
MHASGLVVNVWTVNDGARARALADFGVDGIITDDVPRVLSALSTTGD